MEMMKNLRQLVIEAQAVSLRTKIFWALWLVISSLVFWRAGLLVCGAFILAGWVLSFYAQRFAELARACSRIQRAGEEASERFLLAICGMHAGVQVTLRDSIAAGNCFSGSRKFAREFFPLRKSATVGELLPLVGQNRGVVRVLRYKMLQIGVHV